MLGANAPRARGAVRRQHHWQGLPPTTVGRLYRLEVLGVIVAEPYATQTDPINTQHNFR